MALLCEVSTGWCCCQTPSCTYRYLPSNIQIELAVKGNCNSCILSIYMLHYKKHVTTKQPPYPFSGRQTSSFSDVTTGPRAIQNAPHIKIFISYKDGQKPYHSRCVPKERHLWLTTVVTCPARGVGRWKLRACYPRPSPLSMPLTHYKLVTLRSADIWGRNRETLQQAFV